MDDNQKPGWWEGASILTPLGVMSPSFLEQAWKAVEPSRQNAASVLGAPFDALSWAIRQHPWGRPSDPADPYGGSYFWSSPGEAGKAIGQHGMRPSYTPTPKDQLPTQLPPVMGSEWWRNTLGSMFGALGGSPAVLDRSGRAPGANPLE